MKKILALSFLFFSLTVSLALAEENNISIEPYSGYSTVKGDVQKFRLFQWMKDGSVWGIKDLSFSRNFGEDTTFSFEGSTIPSENDVDVNFSLDKQQLGFLNFDYQLFRKYYDGTGGYYYPFSTLGVNELTQDLRMDIGHLDIEFGPHLSDAFDLSFLVEHHMKEGAKSRLSWTAVTETATRYIGPSWQDIDETTDAYALRAGTEFAGFDVKGENRWEFVNSNLFREEKYLSTASGSGTKIRRQWQEPRSDLMTTTLSAGKWFNEEKSFLNFGYRFYDMDNTEFENLFEYDENGNRNVSYSNDKTKPGATADNNYDLHTWTGLFKTDLPHHLSFVGDMKAEMVKRQGESIYPDDAGDGDGIPDTYEINIAENNLYRFGQKGSLRYSGLPKTSLYLEGEFEQTRNWLTEELRNVSGETAANTANDFNRETLTFIGKSIATLGARVVPTKEFNITAQARRRMGSNDYDDIIESSASSSARSAFIDVQKIYSNEFNTKLTYKPLRWLQSSFRYQYLDNKYDTRVQSQDTQKALMLSHIFTYDVYLQPKDQFLLNASFSNQDMKTSTPAGSIAGTTQTPGFNSNVSSWLLSGSYLPKENLTFTNTMVYSVANNFDDFSSSGLALGEDFNKMDLTLGMNWKPKENINVEPHYSYNVYNTDTTSADYGDYTAHVIWLDLSFDW